jgi:hypothetical protein
LVQESGLLQNGVGVGDVEEGLEMRLRETKAGEVGLGELGGGDLAGQEGVTDGEDLGVWGRGRGGRGLGSESAESEGS